MAKLPDWATGPHDDVEPGVIVRLNPDDTIDEVCIDQGNGAFFHLEQMDDGCYWIGIDWRDAEGKERMQHVTLNTRRNTRIFPTVYT